MPPRGISVDVPQWWLDALTAEVERRGMTRTDLAEIVARKFRTSVATARVKVTRFFDEKDPIRTIEVVRLWAEALSLPTFEFRAASREHAEAMAAVAADPAGVMRAIAAGRLMASLESGEHRLDDLLRQRDSVRSTDGADERRGSRGAATRPASARDQRR